VALLALWLVIPPARAGLLLATNPFRHAPSPPRGLEAQPIRFRATDGISLRGWFVPASARAPTVIVIPGFKDDSSSSAPYARLLHAGGFNVLLYDSRGTGGSGGTFTLGLREVRDVEGAARYLDRRAGLRDHQYGLLGISMGAGVAIVAASHLPGVRAVVADSPYADQHITVDRLDALHLGPLTLPLAPVAPWLVDHVLGAPLSSFSPLRSARKLGGRPLLLIHSRHDGNPTTPLSDALKLKRSAGRSASLWIPPRGGHAGALAAQPTAYRSWVIGFFHRSLR
jgi:dipeptidyl aminopeptidase/acylaminoacyl peptidase